MSGEPGQVWLSPDDRLDYVTAKAGGRIVHFILNYGAFLHGSRREVMRYDTKHGYLHLHRFWQPSGKQVEDLEDRRLPASAYDVQFDEAFAEIRAHWRRYRRRMEAGLK